MTPTPETAKKFSFWVTWDVTSVEARQAIGRSEPSPLVFVFNRELLKYLKKIYFLFVQNKYNSENAEVQNKYNSENTISVRGISRIMGGDWIEKRLM